MIWICIAIYLVFQILIAWYVGKFIKSEGDYFLAGRKAPMWALSFSIFATWFGAETCIGSSAAVFQNGLAGSKSEPFGYAICLFLVGLIIAPKIWNGRYTTLGDMFREKFGVSTEQLAVWVMVPSSIFWAAAQVRALGQVISPNSPATLQIGIMLATLIVIIYTFLGGLMGDIVNDVLQGIVIAIGLGILLFFTIDHLGGPMAAIKTISPEKLTFISPDESFLVRMDRWMIPILGSLIAQEMVARLLAAKNGSMARKASFWGCGIYFFLGSIPILIGLLGHNFNLTLENAEDFIPVLSKTLLPKALYIVFMGAMISAILSTIDSILLAVSALIAHNFLVPKFQITDERKKVKLARLVVAIAGIVSYIIAISSDSVYEMVSLASSFGTTGVLVVTLYGLFAPKGRTISANITLVFGLVLSALFGTVIEVEAPFLTGLLCVFITFVVSEVILRRLEKKESALPAADPASELS
jgi:solute:Na+ symporter, SSS family